MARRVRDASLESRAARGKLKPQGKPYYKAIGEGLHLGYRKGKVEGKWVVRRYAGDQSYITDTIATADDIEDADGDQVLNFWQAQEKAREIGRQAGLQRPLPGSGCPGCLSRPPRPQERAQQPLPESYPVPTGRCSGR